MPYIFNPTNQVELLEDPFGKYEVESADPPDENGIQLLFIIDNTGGVLCTNQQVRLVEKR